MVLNCVFVTFPCGILGQVWYLIVLIPDLFRLSFFLHVHTIVQTLCFESLSFFLHCDFRGEVINGGFGLVLDGTNVSKIM